jgi:hypothetical protein
LSHIDTIATAQREKLPKVVFARPALKSDNQTVSAVTSAAFHAWDALQPFEERSFVVLVTKRDTRVHMSKS